MQQPFHELSRRNGRFSNRPSETYENLPLIASIEASTRTHIDARCGLTPSGKLKAQSSHDFGITTGWTSIVSCLHTCEDSERGGRFLGRCGLG